MLILQTDRNATLLIKSSKRGLPIDSIPLRSFVIIGVAHFSVIDDAFLSVNDKYRFLSSIWMKFSDKISLYLLEICSNKTNADEVKIQQLKSGLNDFDIQNIDYLVKVESDD